MSRISRAWKVFSTRFAALGFAVHPLSRARSLSLSLSFSDVGEMEARRRPGLGCGSLGCLRGGGTAAKIDVAVQRTLWVKMNSLRTEEEEEAEEEHA